MSRWTKGVFCGHSYGAGLDASQEAGAFDLIGQALELQPVDDGTPVADSTTIEDTFTRADSTTMGGSWSEDRGNWQIVSNMAALQAQHGGGSRNVCSWPTTESDGAVEFTTGAAGVNGQGMAFRIVDSLNYLFVQLSATFSTVTVNKCVAGVVTTLDTFAGSVASGVTTRVSLEGSSITVGQSNGGILGTVVDSTFLSATGFGMTASSGMALTARWDSIKWTYADHGSTPDIEVGTWARESSQWKLAAGGRTSTLGGSLLVWDTGYADGQFGYTAAVQAAGIGLAFRVVDESNFLYVLMNATFTTAAMHKVVAGVDSVVDDLDGDSAILADTSNDRLIRVTCCGPYVRLYIEAPDGTGEFVQDYIPGVHEDGTGFGFYAAQPNTARWTDPHALAMVNLSVSGASVGRGQGIVNPLQYLPRLDSSTFCGVMYGINDAIFDVGAPQMKVFQNGLRELVSRLRAKHVYEDDDASCAYSPGDWTTEAATDINSGDGYHSTTTVGATVTITVPGTYAGGALTITCLGHWDDEGGQADIEVDGEPYGTIDTDGLYTGGFDFYGRVCTRITTLTPGAHTIVITTTGISGSFDFDYWAEEHDHMAAPTVRVANLAKLANYQSAWANITDNDVDVYNAALTEVMGEFR